MRRRTGIGATPGADCAPRGASTFTWTVRTFFQASSKPVRGHVRAFRHRNEVFPRPVALELDRMRFDRVDVTHPRLVASVDLLWYPEDFISERTRVRIERIRLRSLCVRASVRVFLFFSFQVLFIVLLFYLG